MRPHRLLRACCAVLCTALVACGAATSSAPPASESGGWTDPNPRVDGETQVVLLVDYGRLMLRDDGWTVSGLATTLRRIDPDLVLVAVPPAEWGTAMFELSRPPSEGGETAYDDVWLDTYPALPLVVVPLAEELGYDIAPFGARDQASRDARAAYDELNPHGPESMLFFTVRARLEAERLSVEPSELPRWLHGDDHMVLSTDVGRWLSYYAEEALGAAGEFTLLARETAALDDLLAEHAGDRVVVLVPDGDRYFIEPALRLRHGSRLLPAADYLP